MAATKKKAIVKAADTRLRDYEVVVIVNPEVADEPLEAAINGVSQFIAGKGGTISDVERWGKRRLAYPIKRFLEGNYVLTRFSMDPAWSKELEANIRISEAILRHLLIEVEGRVAPKAAPQAEAKTEGEAAPAPQAEAKTAGEVTPVPQAEG